MTKITKLTAEQEKQLPIEYADWLRIGRGTEGIDEATTKAVISDFYKRIGKKTPLFLVFDSPLACCVQMPQLLKLLGREDKRPLNEQARDVFNAYWAQGWWTGWIAYYRFAEKIGAHYTRDQSDLLAQFERLAKACHWFFPFENWCLLSRRPVKVEVDQLGRIHGGVEYADGTGVFAHHGIVLPKEAVREPGWVTIDKIDKETNAEIKRAMIEIYGTGKYLMESGAREVQRDEYGVLYSKRVGDETIMTVHVLNSTPEPDGTMTSDEALKTFVKPRWWDEREHAGKKWKSYFLAVHPELRPLLDPDVDGAELGQPQALTAHNAVASTFGMRGEEYAPELET